MQKTHKLVVIGGGAAGFFAAITAAENNPHLKVTILEQGIDVLGKVRISGGGRCNVTHACFDPKELIKFYPRGSKELLGSFYRFDCASTVDWFTQKGVALKTENDGRIFPVSDDSATIIDCLMQSAKQLGITILKQAKVIRFETKPSLRIFFNEACLEVDYILVASGSNPTLWKLLEKAGHSILTPVPSLFTFTIKDELIKGLEGISLPDCTVKISNTKYEARGPVLITHWGLSGPGILKLSAFAAIELAAYNYQFPVYVNWINREKEDATNILAEAKIQHAKKNIGNFSPFDIPSRFWNSLLNILSINPSKKYADTTKEELQKIAVTLTTCLLNVSGKSTHKEEFVTAGGIALKEVDFKTMESKIVPGLFFSGEVLDIDAVTGGFNFQAAWTTGYIAGSSIAEKSLA